MAKYNSSAFGNISGEVLGVVASSNKGVNFIKNKAKITDSKTAKQLARRAIYERFCKLWDEKTIRITQEEQELTVIKKDYFKLALRFCLKFSQSVDLLYLTIFPDNGTMSAPIFKVSEVTPKGDLGSTVSGTLLFPAYSNKGEFWLGSGYFGDNYFETQRTEVRLALFGSKLITNRELTETSRFPNSDFMATIGQKVFRSYWYVNKKTGQISKPLCLACDDSGNVETFYPFGK